MKITNAVILLLAYGAAAIKNKNHRRSNEVRRSPNAAHRLLDDEERGGKGKGKGMVYVSQYWTLILHIFANSS